MSQEAFGALCGVGRVAQANYERGHRSPSVDYIYALAGAGVDAAYVLWGVRKTGSDRKDKERDESLVDIALLRFCLIAVGGRLQDAANGSIDMPTLARIVSTVYSRAMTAAREVRLDSAEGLAAFAVDLYALQRNDEK